MKNLKKHIIDLENQLLDNGCFVNVEIRKPASKTKINSLKKEFKLPDDLVTFYSDFNGLFIGWNCKRRIRCKGRIDVPDLNVLKEYLTLEKENNIFSEYIDLGWIPFDVDIVFGYGTFIIPKGNSYELIRVDSNKNKIKLNITIEHYLKLGIKVMGLYNWQYYTSEETYNSIKKYSNDGFFYMVKEKLGINIEEDFYNPKLVSFSESLTIENYIKTLKKEFDVINHRKNSGCTCAEIRKIEISLGYKLPKDFISFLYSKYSLELHWKYKKVESNYRMLNLGKIFGGINYSENKVWKNSYAIHLDLHESHEKKYGTFYPFIFEESGHTVFRIEENEIQLYFIEDLEPVKINLNFNLFINKLFQCGGISGWQRLFINQYSKDNPEIKEIIKNIEKCFPDLNIEEFIKKI